MANIQLGSKATGSIVKLNENGSPIEFYVVKHDYESGLNGPGRTLLARVAPCEQIKWHSTSVNAYGNSNIDIWLNTTYKNRFDSDIRAAMETTTFYYTPGNGNKTVGTLKRGVFIISLAEVGLSYTYANVEGTQLPIAGTLKSARVGGVNYPQFTRSPDTRNTSSIWHVGNTGGVQGPSDTTKFCHFRPIFTLPSTLSVTDDSMIVTNVPPTTPPSLTLPEHINGGTAIGLSWGASTDSDGNLEGYAVERSVDGGDSWSQIYQGPATQTTNTVPFGTETVMYRVRAYDSAGEYSPWRTSEQREVTNNTAPTAPPRITVPLYVLGGGEVTVTWSASFDSEDNLSGYILERQVDGGEWTEIYRGTALSHTDAITKGWESVGYRVRAFDSHGEESICTAAPVRTVDNNTPPAITCEFAADSSLGVKNKGLSFEYSVDDADGDPIHITETVDDGTLRQFDAQPGETYCFQLEGEAFQRVLNGGHSVAVVAGDGKVESIHAVTFEKSVTACSITMLEAMEADAEIMVMVMAVSGFIPIDANFQIMVSNNANDSEPAWEDATAAVVGGTNYVFQNHEAENGFAFNFRVTAKRGPSGIGGYISSIQGGFQ